MTKSKTRKLSLNKETVKSLETKELQQVGGGFVPDPNISKNIAMIRPPKTFGPFQCN